MADLVTTIIDGTHTRANVKAVIASLEELNVRGVPVPEELARALPVVCAQLLKSDSPRIKSAGAKLVLAALKHNLELAAFADKSARLDSGGVTERQEIKLYGREAPIDDV